MCKPRSGSYEVSCISCPKSGTIIRWSSISCPGYNTNTSETLPTSHTKMRSGLLGYRWGLFLKSAAHLKGMLDECSYTCSRAPPDTPALRALAASTDRRMSTAIEMLKCHYSVISERSVISPSV
jgi:hypothetical protein